MPNNDLIRRMSETIGKDLSQHIEEFSAAFIKKNPDLDPNRIVMIHHVDYSTGKTYIWFEKKRGRSRKEILSNAKE